LGKEEEARAIARKLKTFAVKRREQHYAFGSGTVEGLGL
jgi:hypothetical protein